MAVPDHWVKLPLPDGIRRLPENPRTFQRLLLLLERMTLRVSNPLITRTKKRGDPVATPRLCLSHEYLDNHTDRSAWAISSQCVIRVSGRIHSDAAIDRNGSGGDARASDYYGCGILGRPGQYHRRARHR